MSHQFPLVEFDELVSDETAGNCKTLQSEYLEEGLYPIVDQGRSQIAGYTNDSSKLCCAQLPVIVFGDHTKNLKYIDFPFCLGADGTKILRPKPKLHPKFAYYALNQIEIPEVGYSRHFKYLRRGKIPLPSLDEQRRIAAILDQADALRRKRQRALDWVERLGTAIFEQSFPVAEIGRRPFSELIEIVSGLVDPTEAEFADLPHIGPEHIIQHTGDIRPYRTARQDGVTSGKFLFDERCILYSKIRPNLNKVALAMTRGLCSADMYPIRVHNGIATREYVWFLLRSQDFLAHASGFSNRANIPKLNKEQVLAYLAPSPSFEKQVAFSNRISYWMALKSRQKTQLDMIEGLFTAIQHRAFCGEL